MPYCTSSGHSEPWQEGWSYIVIVRSDIVKALVSRGRRVVLRVGRAWVVVRRRARERERERERERGREGGNIVGIGRVKWVWLAVCGWFWVGDKDDWMWVGISRMMREVCARSG